MFNTIRYQMIGEHNTASTLEYELCHTHIGNFTELLCYSPSNLLMLIKPLNILLGLVYSCEHKGRMVTATNTASLKIRPLKIRP